MKRRAFLKSAGVVGGAAALGIPARSAAGNPRGGGDGTALEGLARAGIALGARITRYEGPLAAEVVEMPLGPRAAARGEAAGGAWACTLRAARVPGRPDAVELVARFALRRGQTPAASVALTLSFARWSTGNYVLFPGACYAGNRFESRHLPYPPLLAEPADIGPNVPIIVSDIPRLNVHAGPSRVQLLASDLATPAVGVRTQAGLGVLVLVDPSTPAGATGLSVEESDDRARATLAVTAPGVREQAMYAAGNTRAGSKDRGAAFRAGDAVSLRVRVHLFECPDVAALFQHAFVARKDLTGPTRLRAVLPFSAAFAEHERRTGARWVGEPGYFASGERDGAYAGYQTGWGGGPATALPLLLLGSTTSRERALRQLAFAFERGQAPSGFFHGVFDGKQWREDGFAAPHARRWHLTRRSADALTALGKQLIILERQRQPPPEHGWTAGLARCADAFARLWDRHRQLGQYVNIDTGDLIVGGSTSAALAPAGLTLAARHLKKPEYLRVAVAIADQMFERYLRAGVTCGGPGDALQCPDSQSAGALLESFVTLWEDTRDAVWIDRARVAAHQLASWVISHDVRRSAFGAPGVERAGTADVDSTGAVLSDAQSKHGSPGYLSTSGEALFRLYRATGDIAYLELLRDTARNLAQYLPAAEAAARAPGPTLASAPAAAVPAATCARADTSDWLEAPSALAPVVGAFDTSSMLSYAELPGLHVQLDEGRAFALDHVEPRIKEARATRLTVTLANPTTADAVVRVLAETAERMARPLEPGAVAAALTVTVPAGGSIDLELPRRWSA